jgi:hypothetical protein
VAETDHFCIYHQTSRKGAERLARVAERTRTRQLRKWFGMEEVRWSEVCQVYLYPSSAAYAEATGVPAESPGHTEVQMAGERVLLRRINLHGDIDDLAEAVLPHEVTHAVLAGRFGDHAVPRWVDEGLAILAEPRERVRRHLSYLEQRRGDLGLYELGTMMRLADYPTPSSRGIFYAQSVSVVAFLSAHKGPQTFTRFVNKGLRSGYERALKEEYGWTLEELEQRWRQHSFSPRQQAAAQEEGPATRAN